MTSNKRLNNGPGSIRCQWPDSWSDLSQLIEARPTQRSNVSSWLSSMTPRSRADCTTLTVEDSTHRHGVLYNSIIGVHGTGMSLMSTCWSRYPAPSHIISVLDGLTRSLLADIWILLVISYSIVIIAMQMVYSSNFLKVQIGCSAREGSLNAKFMFKGTSPTKHFSTDRYLDRQWMTYNFVADSFYTKKLCSRLSSSEVWFYTEYGILHFWAPKGGIRGQRTMIILGSLESA